MKRLLLLILIFQFNLSASCQKSYEIQDIRYETYLPLPVDSFFIYSDCDDPVYGLKNHAGQVILQANYKILDEVEVGDSTWLVAVGSMDTLVFHPNGKRLVMPIHHFKPITDSERHQYERSDFGFESMYNYDWLEYFNYNNYFIPFIQDFINHEAGTMLYFNRPVLNWNWHEPTNRLWVETADSNFLFDENFELLFKTNECLIDVLDSFVILERKETYDPQLYTSYLRSMRKEQRTVIWGYDTRKNKALYDLSGQEVFPYEHEYYAYCDATKQFWITDHEEVYLYNADQQKLKSFRLGSEQPVEYYMPFKKKKTVYHKKYQTSKFYYVEQRTLSMLNDSNVKYLSYRDKQDRIGFVDKEGNVKYPARADRLEALDYRRFDLPPNYVEEIFYNWYYSVPWLYANPEVQTFYGVIGDSLVGIYNPDSFTVHFEPGYYVAKLDVESQNAYHIQGRLLNEKGEDLIGQKASYIQEFRRKYILAQQDSEQVILQEIKGEWQVILRGDEIKIAPDGLNFKTIPSGIELSPAYPMFVVVKDNNLSFFDVVESRMRKFSDLAYLLDSSARAVEVWLRPYSRNRSAPAYRYRCIVNRKAEIVLNDLYYLQITPDAVLVRVKGDSELRYYDHNMTNRLESSSFTVNKKGDYIEFLLDGKSGILNLKTRDTVIPPQVKARIEIIDNSYMRQQDRLYNNKGEVVFSGFSNIIATRGGFLFYVNGGDEFGYFDGSKVVLKPQFKTQVTDKSLLIFTRPDGSNLMFKHSTSWYDFDEKLEQFPGQSCYDKGAILRRDSLYALVDGYGNLTTNWSSLDQIYHSDEYLNQAIRYCVNQPRLTYLSQNTKQYIYEQYQKNPRHYVVDVFESKSGDIITYRSLKNSSSLSYYNMLITTDTIFKMDYTDLFQADSNDIQRIDIKMELEGNNGSCISNALKESIASSFLIEPNGIQFVFQEYSGLARTSIQLNLLIPFTDVPLNSKYDPRY